MDLSQIAIIYVAALPLLVRFLAEKKYILAARIAFVLGYGVFTVYIITAGLSAIVAVALVAIIAVFHKKLWLKRSKESQEL